MTPSTAYLTCVAVGGFLRPAQHLLGVSERGHHPGGHQLRPRPTPSPPAKPVSRSPASTSPAILGHYGLKSPFAAGWRSGSTLAPNTAGIQHLSSTLITSSKTATCQVAAVRLCQYQRFATNVKELFGEVAGASRPRSAVHRGPDASNAGYRFSHYTLSRVTPTPTSSAANTAPIQDILLLSASYNRAVRAPNVTRTVHDRKPPA